MSELHYVEYDKKSDTFNTLCGIPVYALKEKTLAGDPGKITCAECKRLYCQEQDEINLRIKENRCVDCGTKLIDDCLRCGAPQCCPKCCIETTNEHYREQALRKCNKKGGNDED